VSVIAWCSTCDDAFKRYKKIFTTLSICQLPPFDLVRLVKDQVWATKGYKFLVFTKGKYLLTEAEKNIYQLLFVTSNRVYQTTAVMRGKNSNTCKSPSANIVCHPIDRFG
jgi:hypothetical protein